MLCFAPLFFKLSQPIILSKLRGQLFNIVPSKMRQEFKSTNDFCVSDCCFVSISTTLEGGAFYINNDGSTLNISCSTFFQCSAGESGAFSFIGYSFIFDRMFGNSCFITNNDRSTAFFFSRGQIISTTNQSSIFECSNSSIKCGASSIKCFLSGISFDGLNFTHNALPNGREGAIELKSNSDIRMQFSLFAFCTLHIFNSMIVGEDKCNLSVENSSFMNNTIDTSGHFFDWKSIGNLKCTCCIFDNNSEVSVISIAEYGAATLMGCFIQPDCRVANSVTQIEVVRINTGAYPLTINFVDRCARNESEPASRSSAVGSKIGGKEIALIVAGTLFTACFAGGVAVLYLRYKERSNSDFHKARAFELTESIDKEFG